MTSKQKAHQPPGRRAVNRGARRPPAPAPGTGRKAPPRPQRAERAPRSGTRVCLAGLPPGGPAAPALKRPAGAPIAGDGIRSPSPAVAPALGRPAGAPLGPQRGLVAEPAMLLVHQVARRLGVTTQHVRDFIEEGALRAVNVGKGCRKFWRIPPDGYQAFLKSRSSVD